jgi:hypothetical protein
MGFRFRRRFKIVPGIRLADYATRWTTRNGMPLTLDLLAILAIVLVALLMAI